MIPFTGHPRVNVVTPSLCATARPAPIAPAAKSKPLPAATVAHPCADRPLAAVRSAPRGAGAVPVHAHRVPTGDNLTLTQSRHPQHYLRFPYQQIDEEASCATVESKACVTWSSARPPSTIAATARTSATISSAMETPTDMSREQSRSEHSGQISRDDAQAPSLRTTGPDGEPLRPVTASSTFTSWRYVPARRDASRAVSWRSGHHRNSSSGGSGNNIREAAADGGDTQTRGRRTTPAVRPSSTAGRWRFLLPGHLAGVYERHRSASRPCTRDTSAQRGRSAGATTAFRIAGERLGGGTAGQPSALPETATTALSAAPDAYLTCVRAPTACHRKCHSASASRADSRLRLLEKESRHMLEGHRRPRPLPAAVEGALVLREEQRERWVLDTLRAYLSPGAGGESDAEHQTGAADVGSEEAAKDSRPPRRADVALSSSTSLLSDALFALKTGPSHESACCRSHAAASQTAGLGLPRSANTVAHEAPSIQYRLREALRLPSSDAAAGEHAALWSRSAAKAAEGSTSTRFAARMEGLLAELADRLGYAECSQDRARLLGLAVALREQHIQGEYAARHPIAAAHQSRLDPSLTCQGTGEDVKVRAGRTRRGEQRTRVQPVVLHPSFPKSSAAPPPRSAPSAKEEAQEMSSRVAGVLAFPGAERLLREHDEAVQQVTALEEDAERSLQEILDRYES